MKDTADITKNQANTQKEKQKIEAHLYMSMTTEKNKIHKNNFPKMGKYPDATK